MKLLLVALALALLGLGACSDDSRPPPPFDHGLGSELGLTRDQGTTDGSGPSDGGVADGSATDG